MPGQPEPEAPTEIPARQVEIQHADQLQIVIHTGQGKVQVVIQHEDQVTISTIGGDAEVQHLSNKLVSPELMQDQRR